MGGQLGFIGLLIAGFMNMIVFLKSLLAKDVLFGSVLFVSLVILVISFLNLKDKKPFDSNE